MKLISKQEAVKTPLAITSEGMQLQPIQPTDYGLSTEINDPRTKEVLKKFEAFKKWALTVK